MKRRYSKLLTLSISLLLVVMLGRRLVLSTGIILIRLLQWRLSSGLSVFTCEQQALPRKHWHLPRYAPNLNIEKGAFKIFSFQLTTILDHDSCYVTYRWVFRYFIYIIARQGLLCFVQVFLKLPHNGCIYLK